VDGVKINNIEKLDQTGADRRMLAKSFTNSLIKQILVDGFFHADPHPGNVMVTDGGTNIEFIDLGMAGELGPRFRGQLAQMLLGVATQNTREIAQAILDMDTSGANVNLYKFVRALDIMLDEYLYGSVENVSIARVFASVFSLAGDFQLKIARELALVAKSLGTAQVIIEELVPNTSMLALVEDTAQDVLPNRFSPKSVMEGVKNGLVDSAEFARALPAFLLNVMRKVEQNDFSVDINLRHLEELDKNLERISGRISFTIILLALCIVMAGVIVAIGLQAYTNIMLMEISLFALRAGMVIAAIIIVGLAFNIIRTNVRKH
jgi:ubiquinone biosynthesis protein